MARSISRIGLALAAFAPILGLALAQKPKSLASNPQRAFQSTVQPLTKKYCSSCHTGKNALGGFDLSKSGSVKDLKPNEDIWRSAAKRVLEKSMPPAGAPAPTEAERRALSSALIAILGPAKVVKAPPTSHVTLRRLNRAEYNNTIRDLFYGMPFSPADDFPSDDVGYGFDNIGDVLSISPLLMERYLNAAESIVRKAIVIPKVVSRTFDTSNLRLDGGVNANEYIGMYATAKATGTAKLDQNGSYKIKVRAFGQQAGNEPAKMALAIDGKRIAVFEVKAVGEPASYEMPLDLQAGNCSIEVSFINDYYNPKDPDPKNRDRNLILHSIELVGPLAGTTPISEAHRRIMFVRPDPANPSMAAKRIIAELARRAYRRPPTQSEVDGLAKFVELATKDGEPFERGIQLALTAILTSPKFLFRYESDAPKLDPFELATRLSYFLWSTMPDEALYVVAKDGSLLKPDVLTAQIDRMLKDPRSIALTKNFATQWLQLRKLDSMSPDPTLFPEFDASLKSSIRNETEAYFDYMLRNDRPITEFLESDFAFLNERLARHYGIENVAGPELRRVKLSGSRRGGLLTQASFLSVTSNPNRTSPVKRGKFVLEQILGDPPPPPPPGAGAIEGDTDKTPTKTMKERLARHRRDPSCSVCHLKMDAIGFAFENYDPVGKWRDKDGPFEIDAAGKLPDGRSFKSARDMQKLLLGQKSEFVRSLTEKLMTYALGRGMTAADKKSLDAIAAKTIKQGYGLGSMVRIIAASDLFRAKRMSN